MCAPLAIAAAAMYVGGTMLKNQQQAAEVSQRQDEINTIASKQQDQYSQALDAQRQFQQQDAANNARQQDYQQQKQQAFSNVQSAFDPSAQTATQQAAATQRMGTYNASTSQPGTTAPTSADAPQVVNTEIASRMNDAIQYGKQQAQALADMGSWGDAMFGNKVALNDAGQGINQLGSFAQGDNNMLGYLGNIANMTGTNANALNGSYQQQAMQKASAPLTSGGFGSMLMGAGQALGTAGAMGTGPSWGDTSNWAFGSKDLPGPNPNGNAGYSTKGLFG